MNLLAKKKLFLFAILGIWHTASQANLGIAFSSGQGIEDIVPYRFALSWDFGAIARKEDLWGLNATWESSFAVWNGPKRANLAPDRVTDLNAATTGPMFRWQRRHPYAGSQMTPYAELGIGASWLSKTEIEGRVLSLHFQFEDKGGFGMRFGKKQQYDMAIRAYHYSNASIKRPNSGVNMAMMSFGLWFPK